MLTAGEKKRAPKRKAAARNDGDGYKEFHRSLAMGDWDAMPRETLQLIARRYGLADKGTKAVLAERLLRHFHPDSTERQDGHLRHPSVHDNNNNRWELFALVAAVFTWGHLWDNKQILVYVDNLTLTYARARGCKDKCILSGLGSYSLHVTISTLCCSMCQGFLTLYLICFLGYRSTDSANIYQPQTATRRQFPTWFGNFRCQSSRILIRFHRTSHTANISIRLELLHYILYIYAVGVVTHYRK